MKRILMAAGGAAVLLASALGVSYAQTATPSPQSQTNATKARPLAHLRHAELQVAANALGLADVKALRKELAGTTLTAVAQQHNVAASTVADAITGDLNARIQAAVTAGTIKQTRATRLTQRVSTVVNKLMTRQFPAAKNA